MRWRVLLGLVSLVAARTVLATTIHVNADGSGDYPTIQAAVDASVDDDVIELADGIYSGDGNRDIHVQNQDITVRSMSGDPGLCIIDCEGSAGEMHRGFTLEPYVNTAFTLQGVTIENGYMDDGGYTGGGAIFHNWASHSVFVECVFRNNTAGGDCCGGAIYSWRSTNPDIIRCRFEGNRAYNGGAIDFNGFSFIEIRDSVFLDNVAERSGGALFVKDEYDYQISGSLFIRNQAGNGGAIYIMGGNLGNDGSLVECTLVENEASWDTGAVIYVQRASPMITGCIIAFSPNGMALRCNVIGGDSDPHLICCDIFGNADGDWTDCIADLAENEGNISADPFFCDPFADDFSLHNSSPCAPGNHPDEVDCGLIGALPVGCGTTNTQSKSWSAIKALY